MEPNGGSGTEHNHRAELNKLILDLCFKESWTYDKETQNKLIESIIASPPELSLWTHKLLRTKYRKFRREHPDLIWNNNDSFAPNQLQKWIVSKVCTDKVGARPEEGLIDETPREMRARGTSILMLDGGDQAGATPLSSDERCQLIQHLASLQPTWLPNTSLPDVEDAIVRFFRRYGLKTSPTYGFTFQMLQDMEEDHGFLSVCYKRGVIDQCLAALSSKESVLRCALWCMQELEDVSSSVANVVRGEKAAMNLLVSAGLSGKNFALSEQVDVNLFKDVIRRLQSMLASRKEVNKKREMSEHDSAVEQTKKRNKMVKAPPNTSRKSHPFLRSLFKASGSTENSLLFSPSGDRISILATNVEKILRQTFDSTFEEFSTNCRSFGYLHKGVQGLYHAFENTSVTNKDDILFLQEQKPEMEMEVEAEVDEETEAGTEMEEATAKVGTDAESETGTEADPEANDHEEITVTNEYSQEQSVEADLPHLDHMPNHDFLGVLHKMLVDSNEPKVVWKDGKIFFMGTQKEFNATILHKYFPADSCPAMKEMIKGLQEFGFDRVSIGRLTTFEHSEVSQVQDILKLGGKLGDETSAEACESSEIGHGLYAEQVEEQSINTSQTDDGETETKIFDNHSKSSPEPEPVVSEEAIDTPAVVKLREAGTKVKLPPRPPKGRELGAWVLAYFKETDGWYLGVISAIRVPTGRRTTKYDVIFHDGDTAEGLDTSEIYTESYHRKKNLKPKMTDKIRRELTMLTAKVLGQKVASVTAYAQMISNDEKRGSLEKLFESRCGSCDLCQRPDCTRCESCKHNKEPRKGAIRVCLHKMCLNIPLEEKRQRVPGFPDGWTFVVDKPHDKACGVMTETGVVDIDVVPGLSLFTPNNYRLRSVHKVKNRWHELAKKAQVERQLYDLLGVPIGPSADVVMSKSSSALGAAKSNEVAPGTTTDRKAKRSATAKLVSDNAPWGKRVGCIVYCRFRRNKTFYWGKITDIWWKDSILHYQVDFLDGSGDVEADITEFPLNGEKLDKGEKNMYSIEEMREQGVSVPQCCINHADNDEKEWLPISGKRFFGSPFTLLELEKERCGRCNFCQAKDCGECVSCLLLRKNGIGKAKKQSCIRKMCKAIPLEKKAQTAPGFPRGWRFAFYVLKNGLGSNLDARYSFFDRDVVSISTLKIISPENRVFSNIDKAFEHCEGDLGGGLEDRKNEFSRYIGANILRYEPNHPLVGKKLRFEWLDLDYKPRELFGHVTSVARREDGAYNSIVYTNFTKVALKNHIMRKNELNAKIKTEEQVDESQAWGAAINFHKHFGSFSHLGNCDYMKNEILHWIVPDMVISETVSDATLPGRRKVPRLTVQVRGFSLTFTAKKSSIKNAGFGVFVTCTPLFDGVGDTFTLKDGELVDLGFYAPLRLEDRKLADVFLMKNFVLGSLPEIYSFSSPQEGEQFDITDDVSGQCHKLARERIPMYVNECNADKVHPTIHAHYDPEGNIHYLFGHMHTKKLLELPVGTEREVFVNYGQHYEEVRIRENYSFLDDEEEEIRLCKKMELAPLEYLTSITQTFSIRSIFGNIDYFSKYLLQFQSNGDEKLLQHILTVILLLRHRVPRIKGDKHLLVRAEQRCSDIIGAILDYWDRQELRELEKAGQRHLLVQKAVTALFSLYPRIPKHHVHHFLNSL